MEITFDIRYYPDGDCFKEENYIEVKDMSIYIDPLTTSMINGNFKILNIKVHELIKQKDYTCTIRPMRMKKGCPIHDSNH